MKILKNEKFADLVKEGIHLVDFYADWCGPCQMLGEILNDIDSIDIIKVNTDNHQELALKHGVMTIPALFFYKDGKIIAKEIGFKTKEELEEIIAKIKD